MTEAEWLACTVPQKMLAFLRSRANDRKLRLFALACFRPYRSLLVQESLDALAVAERFAEGLASSDERQQARQRAFHAGWCPDPSTAHGRGHAKACVTGVLARRPYDAAIAVSHHARQIGVLSKRDWQADALEKTECGLMRIVDWSSGVREQLLLQVDILRDIFGNPFHPVTIEPNWLTPDVLEQAPSIYDEHAVDRLPLLADTLAATGCNNEELLTHCRSGKPHFHGCWVVDLILGKM